MGIEKSGVKTKYDNKCMVSYPTPLYLEARKWANRKGLSIQDLQRKAMDFYINHLNHDSIVFTQDANTGKRTPNSNDVKRANSYVR
jgi:hypothetical protein